MRIDLFLKLSRLVKRRALAREMVEMGAVKLNGRNIRPSAEVRVFDRIEVAYPRRVVTVEMLTDDERIIKRGEPSFRVIEDRRVEVGDAGDCSSDPIEKPS
ncbi:MAG: S4 domain-containing protein [Synergistales bacterium]|jgi:ribosomal 50S subunit-recycling heat shock protein